METVCFSQKHLVQDAIYCLVVYDCIVKPFFVATRYIASALPRMSCSFAPSTYHRFLDVPFPSSLRSSGLNMTSSCFQNSTDGCRAVELSGTGRTTTAGHRRLKVLLGFVGEERCGILRWLVTLCNDCKHPVSQCDQPSSCQASCVAHHQQELHFGRW